MPVTQEDILEMRRDKLLLAELLVEKWATVIPSNSSYKPEIAQIIGNQERFFKHHEIPKQVPMIFGESWKEALYRGIAGAFDLHPVMRMVSVQPHNNPAGLIFYHDLSVQQPPLKLFTEAVNGKIKRQVALRDTVAVPRKMRSQVRAGDNLIKTFSSAFDEITRECLNEMFHACRADYGVKRVNREHLVADVEDVFERFCDGFNVDHVNWIAAWPEICDRLRSRFPGAEFWADECFPHDHILAWHQGVDPLDTPFIYAPMYFMFDSITVDFGRYGLRHRASKYSANTCKTIVLEIT